MTALNKQALTDEAISQAFTGTNFGRDDLRNILAETVIDAAAGWRCGHTATTICTQLGLLTPKGCASALGLRFVSEHVQRETKRLKNKLEAAEKCIEEEICRANREHHRGFMMACNHLKEHANVHYADAAEMEIAALRQRIAELEVFISQSCYVFDGLDADISDSYIDASTSSLMPKVSTKNEGEPCRYCSDGSYSGLPGGACEHCMGTGLDNPATGIGVKGE